MTRHRFKPRRYGYGATQITWEGWALIVGIAAVVALSVVAMNLLADRSNVDAWLAWAAFIVIAVLWMVRISRQRTNGEWCWRWGQRRDEGI